ncbi:class I mannose-6-phosphate isomerase [Gryllotalpicola reticulitermitis]|uniref:Class I mannose-6-phosphate isomerase n=1 Tax=Gryllotalpicola reticulitermitis TaxID=1184153 RepID=A0ABV8QB64_9MICO
MAAQATRVRISNYDKTPATRLGREHHSWRGAGLWQELAQAALEISAAPVIAIDAYPGADIRSIVDAASSALDGWNVIDSEEATAKPTAEIDTVLAPFLTDDRVFGVISHVGIDTFFDEAASARLAAAIATSGTPTVLVGWGASRVLKAEILVLADMARWELQLRQRAGAPNWRSSNVNDDPLTKYKRGFFVEWRVADEHKRSLFGRLDYCLDTNRGMADAVLIRADTLRAGLAATAATPFRVVPFFDPGVWGGQWMREVCDLSDDAVNYAWCFDCVPEENSLYLDVDGARFELPALDLVLTHPRELLGERTFARFGAEFPIRFDFLDTMEGGNLSLQVHPLTDYIQRVFGMTYTQDESYYLLDAEDDAVVYLGLKTGADPERMIAALESAATGERAFPASDYVNTFPARKHDHFLIPAGTVHCSGANSMVLEISATPFIFTFKMWDWDRLGLDGKPRPINIEHAKHNIQWSRDTEWTERNLVNRVEKIAEGDGWVEERTGLHELEFIEVRRIWFSGTACQNTEGTVNVLNLVEGREAIVESPTSAFEPFIVHYAETFIVPAAVGGYTIRPHGEAEGTRCGVVKAYVRGTQTEGARMAPGN